MQHHEAPAAGMFQPACRFGAGSRDGSRKPWRAGLLAFVSALVLPLAGVHAVPMLDVTGSPADVGGTITVSLADTVTDFEAADVSVLFDPAVLAFEDVSVGSLTTGFFVFGDEIAAGAVNVSIFGFPPVAGTGSLLIVSFQAIATGTSAVDFIDRFPGEPGLYHFDPLQQQVEVQAPVAVPVPPLWAIFGLVVGGLTARRWRVPGTGRAG